MFAVITVITVNYAYSLYMANLHSVVYLSSSFGLMSDAELEALLIEARQFNQAHEITGVLLYAGGTFMQCLEGEEYEVELVYERIKDSSQHRGITELMKRPIKERSFPDWLMGLSRPTASELLQLGKANWSKALAHQSLKDSIEFRLLKNFWRRAP